MSSTHLMSVKRQGLRVRPAFGIMWDTIGVLGGLQPHQVWVGCPQVLDFVPHLLVAEVLVGLFGSDLSFECVPCNLEAGECH